MAGGELTLADLELKYSPQSKFYIAPLQMKANCGILVIDDFGRQLVQPKELLNRWIVPMEARVDHLSLLSGETIEIPFELLLVFSTNIPPSSWATRRSSAASATRSRWATRTRRRFLEILRMVCDQQQHPLLRGGRPLPDRALLPARPAATSAASTPATSSTCCSTSAASRAASPASRREWIDLACASYFIDDRVEGLQDLSLKIG